MSDKSIRVLTAASVLVVAAIAAAVSFVHIEHLAVTHGQTLLAAVLLPVSIDGTVVAASMVMLRAARTGMATPWLARVMLAASVAATLAANVAYGVTFGLTGALLSGWPAAAFIGSAEMALGMVRRATRKATPKATSPAVQVAPAAPAGPLPKAARKATAKATAKATRQGAGRGAEAAAGAAREAVQAGSPVPSARALARQHRIGRDTAGRVLASVAAEANGHGGQPGSLTST